MKLYVLDLGKIVMMNENPVTSGDSGGEGEYPAIPVHAFLIDSPAGKILFDTGCAPDGMDGAWPPEMCENPYVAAEDQTLAARLAQLGIAPADIDTVVLSHLHLDHAGCAHPFTGAKVYVQAEEYRKTMENDRNGVQDLFHTPCDIRRWEEAGLDFCLVEEETRTLCDGVTILNLGPGHSFGMLALLVELPHQNYLLVSDAAYSADHYGPPAKLSGLVYDEPGYFHAIEKIRDYEERYHAVVCFGHDMAQYETLVKSPMGCYQ